MTIVLFMVVCLLGVFGLVGGIGCFAYVWQCKRIASHPLNELSSADGQTSLAIANPSVPEGTVKTIIKDLRALEYHVWDTDTRGAIRGRQLHAFVGWLVVTSIGCLCTTCHSPRYMLQEVRSGSYRHIVFLRHACDFCPGCGAIHVVHTSDPSPISRAFSQYGNLFIALRALLADAGFPESLMRHTLLEDRAALLQRLNIIDSLLVGYDDPYGTPYRH